MKTVKWFSDKNWYQKNRRFIEYCRETIIQEIRLCLDFKSSVRDTSRLCLLYSHKNIINSLETFNTDANEFKINIWYIMYFITIIRFIVRNEVLILNSGYNSTKPLGKKNAWVIYPRKIWIRCLLRGWILGKCFSTRGRTCVFHLYIPVLLILIPWSKFFSSSKSFWLLEKRNVPKS